MDALEENRKWIKEQLLKDMQERISNAQTRRDCIKFNLGGNCPQCKKEWEDCNCYN